MEADFKAWKKIFWRKAGAVLTGRIQLSANEPASKKKKCGKCKNKEEGGKCSSDEEEEEEADEEVFFIGSVKQKCRLNIVIIFLLVSLNIYCWCSKEPSR